ncbi:MAG: endopeptidase La [Acidobacteria bacterium]|nr:MAG: endopeptidase La [Acidobacteriota bacterium]
MSNAPSSPPDAPRDAPAPRAASNGAGEEPIPAELSILPLKDTVVYPGMSVPLVVGRPASRKLVDAVILEERILGLIMQHDATVEEPAPDSLHEVGTAAKIIKLLKFPDGNLRLIVRGMERIRIQRYTATAPYLKARIEVLHDAIRPGLELDALAKNVSNLLQKMFDLMPIVPEEVSAMLLSVEDPGRLADAVAAVFLKDAKRKQEILRTLDVRQRLETITRLLSQEIEVMELGSKIQQEVQDEMGKSQKDYILRQQLKAIQRELGEEDEATILVREFEEKIAAAGMSEEAETEARRELERLKVMPTSAAEHTVARTYLEWMVDLPWSRSTQDNLDVAHARRILDEDHYDLEKIKDRILEYLAVRKLKDDMKGPIICLAGPPGTGKTSLGRSIARAMGREFHRMSLGGVRDEAEIRGHRRTYVGALPGRIIQALRKVKTNNPVIILDEIDKLGADFRGDPSSALLEVLDPQQNDSFTDHYLGVAFDLSRVLFIATANMLDTIPAALRDRMEVLHLAGYTLNEKLQISRRYLVPRQLENHGLTADRLAIRKDALGRLISGYTREAGVRQLERSIGSIVRKVARELVEGEDPERRVVLRAGGVAHYLGPIEFESEIAERTAMPGVATGLAWTAAGGEILFIESARMPGSKTLTLTGQLGDVMKESAQTALSLVRSRSATLGLPTGFFFKSDLHLHVPAGATPKDGPSAGVAMATSLASLLTGRLVRSDMAMTGEITLRGKVLPVGGVKEKVLAAHRAGIRLVILPRRNRKDLDEIPEDVRQHLEFVFADVIEDVWEAALLPAQPGRQQPSSARGSDGGSHATGSSPPALHRSV